MSQLPDDAWIIDRFGDWIVYYSHNEQGVFFKEVVYTKYSLKLTAADLVRYADLIKGWTPEVQEKLLNELEQKWVNDVPTRMEIQFARTGKRPQVGG